MNTGITIGADGNAVEPQELADDTGMVIVDQTKPWGHWTLPVQFAGDLKLVNAYRAEDGKLMLQTKDETGAVSNELGHVDEHGIERLAYYAGFPSNFVTKLPIGLQAEIINDRVKSSGYNEFSFLSDGGKLTHLLPEWREVLPYSVAAQRIFDVLAEQYGGENLTIKEAALENGVMRLLILTPQVMPVTPALGDTLQRGIMFESDYGGTMKLGLWADRLVCLNGMRRESTDWKWMKRNDATPERQLDWIRAAILGTEAEFEEMVENAVTMAATEIDGDPREVLVQRVNAMRIPKRYHNNLLRAFDQEPGTTEWHILNAITYMATHDNDIPVNNKRAFQLGAGNYTSNFRMVTAELPQSIAAKVGARITGDVVREAATA